MWRSSVVARPASAPRWFWPSNDFGHRIAANAREAGRARPVICDDNTVRPAHEHLLCRVMNPAHRRAGEFGIQHCLIAVTASHPKVPTCFRCPAQPHAPTLASMHDEWAVARRYFSAEYLASLTASDSAERQPAPSPAAGRSRADHAGEASGSKAPSAHHETPEHRRKNLDRLSIKRPTAWCKQTT
jgi:hypothetical protein